MLQAEVIAKAKDPEVTKSKLCTRGQRCDGEKAEAGSQWTSIRLYPEGHREP